ncbi:MAG: ABC transporter transmembrane domain-containing protein [Gemmatimonadota bacterium]|nr:ABC transporter transmembrane domain-containing protein [Gemmatimonadota bacterium]
MDVFTRFSQLSNQPESVRFRFGEVVIEQGAPGDGFYMIKSGRLRVIKRNRDGQPETVGFLYSGDHFGEGALLTGQGRRAAVRAAEDSVVLKVSRDEFLNALKGEGELEAHLQDQVANIAYRDFTRYLKGSASPEGMRVLFSRLKREEIPEGATFSGPGHSGGRFCVVGSGGLNVILEDGSTHTLDAGVFFEETDSTGGGARAIRSRVNCVIFYLEKSDLESLNHSIPALTPLREIARQMYREPGSDRSLSSEVQSGGIHVHAETAVVNSAAAPNGDPYDAPNTGTSDGQPRTSTSFRFPFLKQNDQSDCGAACLGMTCKYYKMPIGLNRLRDMCNVSRDGTSMAALAEAAETLGFVTRGVRTGYEALIRTELPAILHWEGNHFVVLYEINKKEVKIADPGVGIRRLTRPEFEKSWTNMALLLEYTDRVAENQPSRSSFKRFFPLIKPYTAILVEVLLASLVLSLFGLASPVFTQTIVDQVLVHHDEDLLNLMLAGMVVVALFQMGTSTLRAYLIGYMSARLSLTMLSRFYRHLLGLSMRFFALRRTGDLTTRFKENATIQRLFTDTTISAILDFIMLFVYLGLMFFYNWELTLVMLIFVPLSVGLTLIYTPILKSFSQRAFLARAEQSSVLIDSLHGIDVVKAEAVEHVTRWQWEGKFTKEIQIGFRRLKMEMLFGAGGSMINLLSSTVILWYGATLVIDGELSVGQLMAFNALIGNVMGPIMGLIGVWPEVQEARVALDRLNDVYDSKMEDARQRGQGLRPKQVEGRLVFEGVFFRYGVGSDEPYVLNNIDLELKSGQRVAIVGRSGAGKTTFVKLVPRLFDPTEGRVLLDGMDVRDFDPHWLRRQVGMVMQDSFLFSGTIAENIAVGEQDADMDRLLEVARLACVHDFVNEMPLGYETKVGEQGIGLSGGQRQRIAIARALYRDPKVLIFDEATNALDTESEGAIQANLALFLENRTAFVIAHRLSTVRNADNILVMEKGHIVDMGTHDELMAGRGLYYHMCSQQLQMA